MLGLFVQVKPNGSKLWQFKYRMNGKEHLLSIGLYPDVSLAQGHKTKDGARANVAAGIDPSEAKQEENGYVEKPAGRPIKLGAVFLAKHPPKGGEIRSYIFNDRVS